MKIIFDIDPEDLEVNVIPWEEDRKVPPIVRAPHRQKVRDGELNKSEGGKPS